MAENTTLPPPSAPAYDRVMEARVAILEEIAQSMKHTLARIDARMVRLEDRQQSDFRWLFGLGLAATAFLLAADAALFAFMGHGFHWF